MAVSKTNLFTEPRDVIVSLLKTNVTDPNTNKKNSSRRWIYRLDMDSTSITFDAYPVIIVAPVDASNDALTLNNCTLDNDMIFEITIKAEFNDPKSRTDTIANEVFDALTKETSLDTLETNNMFTPQLLSSTPAPETKDRKLLSTRLMRFTFNNTI